MPGSQRRFCSSVPKASSGCDDRLCTLTATATAAQRAAISSSTCRYTSYGWPPPPHSSGCGRLSSPAAPNWREDPVRIRLGLLVRVDDRVEHLVGDVAGEGDQVCGVVGGQQPVHWHVRASDTLGDRECRVDRVDPVLGIAEQHLGVLPEEQRVLHARIARGHGPLEHDHMGGVPDRSTGMPAIGLLGSSDAAGFTVSLAPMTRTTSVLSKSSLISSISSTMS